ncbi:hypothetical protein SAMD00079811_35880 [Scytonema sp. HK-05]|uniref:hypothetical protein n=1 Tax=Scytonema sp. HK-05 TaxID=1137095 RepID=UPI000936C8A9|nr:hypothetical protein [Scytonema sp. HK-05]OKH60585.1 hypothetical protein NIES2130_02390 [Scytonema sp. HK-05]BAY45981.1 hypothetical protein SAMD00079811_35880 [Scytonema sp. HK-05]
MKYIFSFSINKFRALGQEVLARQQAEEQAEQERQRTEQAELQVQQLKERLRSSEGRGFADRSALTLMLLIDTPMLKRILLASYKP